MIHNTIHLNSPGFPQPILALQVQNHGVKHQWQKTTKTSMYSAYRWPVYTSSLDHRFIGWSGPEVAVVDPDNMERLPPKSPVTGVLYYIMPRNILFSNILSQDPEML